MYCVAAMCSKHVWHIYVFVVTDMEKIFSANVLGLGGYNPLPCQEAAWILMTGQLHKDGCDDDEYPLVGAC